MLSYITCYIFKTEPVVNQNNTTINNRQKTKNKISVRDVREVCLNHFNAQSMSNKFNSINVFFHKNDPDIFCVSETWLNDENELITHLKSYKLVSIKNRLSHIHGVVAIFCKTEIICKDIVSIKELSTEMQLDCRGVFILELKTNNNYYNI